MKKPTRAWMQRLQEGLLELGGAPMDDMPLRERVRRWRTTSPWPERIKRGLLKGLGAGVVYAVAIEPRWLEVSVVDIPVVGLHPGLDGYRIVHLSDLHHNLVTGERFLMRAFRTANALRPDLTLLTGDYISHKADRADTIARWLGALRARDGVYATLGNHDYRVRAGAWRRAFRQSGIRLLNNTHEVVAISDWERRQIDKHNILTICDRCGLREPGHALGALCICGGRHRRAAEPPKAPARASSINSCQSGRAAALSTHRPAPGRASGHQVLPTPPRLCLVGVGDLWMGDLDLAAALRGAPSDETFRILLSHNPEIARLLAPADRVGLVLSGHTHGGQAWVFNRPLLRPDAEGRRYLRGLVQSPHAPVYISRGVGSSAIHLRWNCRPEIALLRLRRVEVPDAALS